MTPAEVFDLLRAQRSFRRLRRHYSLTHSKRCLSTSFSTGTYKHLLPNLFLSSFLSQNIDYSIRFAVTAMIFNRGVPLATGPTLVTIFFELTDTVFGNKPINVFRPLTSSHIHILVRRLIALSSSSIFRTTASSQNSAIPRCPWPLTT